MFCPWLLSSSSALDIFEVEQKTDNVCQKKIGENHCFDYLRYNVDLYPTFEMEKKATWKKHPDVWNVSHLGRGFPGQLQRAPALVFKQNVPRVLEAVWKEDVFKGEKLILLKVY